MHNSIHLPSWMGLPLWKWDSSWTATMKLPSPPKSMSSINWPKQPLADRLKNLLNSEFIIFQIEIRWNLWGCVVWCLASGSFHVSFKTALWLFSGSFRSGGMAIFLRTALLEDLFALFTSWEVSDKMQHQGNASTSKKLERRKMHLYEQVQVRSLKGPNWGLTINYFYS